LPLEEDDRRKEYQQESRFDQTPFGDELEEALPGDAVGQRLSVLPIPVLVPGVRAAFASFRLGHD
jgi:hypothetical protein